MIGCYDFCAHYEWTFEWLRQQGGDELVQRFWKEAIGEDSQVHASALIKEKAFAGMGEYWGKTLAEEEAGYVATKGEEVFRLDMYDCPSKGFLISNGLQQFHDYCDHCIGWIGPVMKAAGFRIDHEHNHCGKCWWEFRRASDPEAGSPPGNIAGVNDVRNDPAWKNPDATLDVFRRATAVQEKLERNV